jgi:Asp-tRNA(Asn)/Glu-tRNA(Gln) amidotransferase A subunit family amidase
MFREYENFDGVGLAELVRRGEVSAKELLEAAIERVEDIDPGINAVVQKLYDYGEAQVRAGLPKGPFAGVPFLVKDHGLQVAGVPCADGSRFRSDKPAAVDGTLTRRYLAAGLVIFGKTNTPEFAISGSTESAASGPCRNPWDRTRSAGGSSGGAAAAVAAGYVPMAHATDGGGSIRNPASACGVFGLKPTRTRVPFGPDSFEEVGGMSAHHAITGTVRDSAALLDASASGVPGDPYPPLTQAEPFLEAMARPPRRLRIAFHAQAHRRTLAVHPECVKAVSRTAKICEELGHIVEEARPPIDGDEDVEIGSVFWKVAAARSVARLSATLGRGPAPGELEGITRALAEEGSAISATAYCETLDRLHRFGRRLAGFFASFDVVLSPVLSRPAWRLGEYDSRYTDSQSFFETVSAYSPFCWPYNMSGQPAMSVPLHWTDEGLPVGLQFAGRYGDEATLLQLAAQLEQAAPWGNRRPLIGTSSQA